MENALIVYGALRSGSTMVRLMIDGHPALCCTGEHDFLFDYLRRSGTGLRYNRAALEDDWIYRGSGVRIAEGLDGPDALHDMIRQIAEIGGGRPVLMIHRRVKIWTEVLPDAPVVHLLRDPRDVARSSIGMGWAGNVYRGLDHWIRTEEEWKTAPEAIRARACALRYEALLADPRGELARVCAAFGVTFDEAMLGYSATSTYDAPDPSLAEQWRRKASPHEIALVEGRVGGLMRDLGYDPSGVPPRVPGAAERLAIDLDSKARTFGAHVRRYGIATTLRQRVGRRLGFDAMARDARRDMADATRARLK